MLTVKYEGSGLSVNLCSGLHLINAYYISPFGSISDLCDGNALSTQVWVSTNYSTISDAYAYGAIIAPSEDCTSCAVTGWYIDNPIGSNAEAYFWWGPGPSEDSCSWGNKESCGSSGTQHSLLQNNSSSKLCNDLGTGVTPYLDDTFSAATGMWDDAALSQTWSGNSTWWYKKPGEPLIRRWQDDGTSGGTFYQENFCELDENPGETTRYQHGVYYHSNNPNSACDGSSMTVWSDNQVYSQSTEHWTSETGSSRPSAGYYVTQLAPMNGTTDVMQATSGGQLSDSGVNCNNDNGFGPGDEPTGPGDGFAP